MRHLVAWMVLAAGAALAQTPTAVLERARLATFRVDSANCQGGSRNATGFLWNGKNTVVTSLHVVAGCGTVSVYSETQGRSIKARVVHALAEADLAMLQLVEDAKFAAPFDVRAAKPAVHETVTALGYPLIVPKMDSTDLIVKFGGGTLADIVPEKTRQELAARKSPSVTLEITDFQGALLPGLSGSPILDKQGLVVAIGDGGLENGTVGRSWGVPVRYLAELAQSRETPIPTAADPHLFAAELEVHPGETVRCGADDFTKIRTIAFNEILHSTDDPLGLTQLVNYSASAGANVTGFQYDIYQSAKSGAAFAAPAGAQVSSGKVCKAQVVQGIEMQWQMSPERGIQDVQSVSLRYENMQTPPPYWQPDPKWSYMAPMTRADGLMTRRKYMVHLVPNMYNQPLFDQAAYETLAAKGNAFIGTTAFNRWYNSQVYQLIVNCQSYRQPQCGQLMQPLSYWAEAVIATHLTTFPQ